MSWSTRSDHFIDLFNRLVIIDASIVISDSQRRANYGIGNQMESLQLAASTVHIFLLLAICKSQRIYWIRVYRLSIEFIE